MKKEQKEAIRNLSTEELIKELEKRISVKSGDNSSSHHNPLYEAEITIEEVQSTNE